MCEPALLCRLTCARFVASTATAVVTDLGGVRASYTWKGRDVTVEIQVVGSRDIIKRTLTYDALMGNVSPRGEDGGGVQTAALARRAVQMLRAVKVLRHQPTGVAPSLPRELHARDIAAMAAAFAGLKLHSFSTQMRTALLSQCVSLVFNGGFVLISAGEATRKVCLPAGCVFVGDGGRVYTHSDDERFNGDIVAVGVCHMLSCMV